MFQDHKSRPKSPKPYTTPPAQLSLFYLSSNVYMPIPPPPPTGVRKNKVGEETCSGTQHNDGLDVGIELPTEIMGPMLLLVHHGTTLKGAALFDVGLIFSYRAIHFMDSLDKLQNVS